MPALLSGQSPAKKRFAIALHGGAGRSAEKIGAPETTGIGASLAQALDIGVRVLEGGGTSLDAVEQVIRFLEDDPLFNAGRGRSSMPPAGTSSTPRSWMAAPRLAAASRRSAP